MIPDLVYVGDGADLNVLHDRMGRPKTADDYALGDIPDPLKGNFTKLSTKAHELGVTDAQLKGITESIIGDYTESLNVATAAADATKTEVAALFGEATDEKLGVAGDFAKQLGFDEKLVSAIRSGAVGADNLKAFDAVMKGFESPGPRIGDDLTTELTHLTPEQAEIKLAEIMDNKESPYWNGSHPAHSAMVKKVVELTRAADAGKPQTETEKFRDALMGRG